MGDHDSHEVLQRIDALLPSLRERAQEAEDLRRIPDSSIKALQESGFFKLLQPAQWGGYEADPVTFYTAVRTIASACGSTGWVSGIIGVHNWHLALFDQQAQEDVWSEDADVRISSSYAPMGAGEVVDGGYKVNGAWAWSSGSEHATWVVVGGPVIKDGRPVDFGSFLIPRSEYEIDDVWNVVGLRGTGSNTIVVKDVFVPRHRFLSFKTMNDLASPGLERNTAPVYKMPWGTIHPTTISTPIVGMAYGAYDAHVEHQASVCAPPTRGRRPRTTRSRRSASPRHPATSTPRGVNCRAMSPTSTPTSSKARTFPSSSACAHAATRFAQPVAPSPRSTGSSRIRVPPPSPTARPSNASGATHTPVVCTLRTMPSAHT